MRRTAASALVGPLALASPLAAQAPAAPPYAWLYGAWVGGIFPAPVTLSARECLSQPSVIFTRDVVMRAVMTTPALAERLINSARPTSTGIELQLEPAQSAADPTFGCPNPDVLPIQRRGDDQISFPGCTDFPYPLIRCATR